MVSYLDCIERIPQVLADMLSERNENLGQFLAEAKKRTVDELVFVGSGSSYTSSVTSRRFVDIASGLRTTTYTADEFLNDHFVRNRNAAYIFTSQTGTSKVVRAAQAQFRDAGFFTAAISETPATPLAKETPVYINLGCGIEEYDMRTIGYCASVFTHMLLGLELGRQRGFLSAAAADAYVAEAAKIGPSNAKICAQTMAWMDKYRRSMMRAQLIAFTGTGSLYGLALEGAMKVWEVPQTASVGYELEDGMHGPNYGYTKNHCVVVLHDGTEQDKALALAGYVKNVVGNGYVCGPKVLAADDLLVQPVTENFTCLEMAPIVQVAAYRLAVDGGRDLTVPSDERAMHSYFSTHEQLQ